MTSALLDNTAETSALHELKWRPRVPKMRTASVTGVPTGLDQGTINDLMARVGLDRDVQAQQRFDAQSRIFALAQQGKHAEVIAAVEELERQATVSFALEMQRLYALSASREYATALARAERLTATYPRAPDLALVQADLLAQLERRPEAVPIWQRLVREHARSPVAMLAAQRLNEQPEPPEEEAIYSMVQQQRHREAVAAIDERERAGQLTRAMAMQRIYSLQQSGAQQRALDTAARLAAEDPEFVEAALIQADLLILQGRSEEAAVVLKRVKQEQADTLDAEEAAKRLRGLPDITNLD